MTNLRRVRAWKRRLTCSLAIALTLGTAVLVGTPLRAAAAETLTLTTSSTTANAGTTVTLTATASPTPPPGYTIRIDETPSAQYNVASCPDSNPCSTSVSYPSASTHSFKALLLDSGYSILATSNTVTVTWTGTATYTLTLDTQYWKLTGGQADVLTATASPSTPTGYRIDIWATSSVSPNASLVGSCLQVSPCTTTVSHGSGQYSFWAFLDHDSVYEYPPTPNSTLASAGPVMVTWTPPSELNCNPPTLSILDGQVAGLDLLFDVKSGAAQSAVCVRVDNGGSTAVGGTLLINAAVSPTLPTTLAGNSCAGAQGNTVPGTHPLVDLNVLGQPVFLDVYSGPNSNGALWVCASVGGVANTVVLSVGIGTLPLVTFVPDPDSLVG